MTSVRGKPTPRRKNKMETSNEKKMEALVKIGKRKRMNVWEAEVSERNRDADKWKRCPMNSLVKRHEQAHDVGVKVFGLSCWAAATLLPIDEAAEKYGSDCGELLQMIQDIEAAWPKDCYHETINPQARGLCEEHRRRSAEYRQRFAKH